MHHSLVFLCKLFWDLNWEDWFPCNIHYPFTILIHIIGIKVWNRSMRSTVRKLSNLFWVQGKISKLKNLHFYHVQNFHQHVQFAAWFFFVDHSSLNHKYWLRYLKKKPCNYVCMRKKVSVILPFSVWNISTWKNKASFTSLLTRLAMYFP